MTLDEIREALRVAGLERLADVAERLTLPAIRVEPQIVDEETLPVGASKLGGRPDLPPDMAWPERDGKPLGFLAQFNRAEVAPYDVEKALPPSGMLYFFYDFADVSWGLESRDRGHWQVTYSNKSVSVLSRAEWPDTLLPLYWLPAQRLGFVTALSLIEEPTRVANTELWGDEQLVYSHLVESLKSRTPKTQTEEGVAADSEGDNWFESRATQHQVLGHYQIVHIGLMPLECDYVSAGKPNPLYGELRRKSYEDWDEQTKADLQRCYKDWRLLFQLGNISGLPFPGGGEEDDDPVWELSRLCDLWARGGLMYFWIERDRLAQRDFSNVWMLGASQL